MLTTNAHAEEQEFGTPATVPALLRSLHMNDATAETQKVALRAWLSSHPPSASLRLSLLSNGYGLLLGHRLR